VAASTDPFEAAHAANTFTWQRCIGSGSKGLLPGTAGLTAARLHATRAAVAAASRCLRSCCCRLWQRSHRRRCDCRNSWAAACRARLR
jgi:hypothetical protein